MKSFQVFQITVFLTFILFLTSIVTPVASVAINLLNGQDANKYLEFVCVYCQYGSVDNDPTNQAIILNFTPFDFYYMWIPMIFALSIAFISVGKAFPVFKLSDKISDTLAVKSLWILAIVGFVIRGIFSLLLPLKVQEYQEYFPENQIIGQLVWSSGAIVIGSIMATAAAMIGYIEFLYEMEETSPPENVSSS